MSTPPDALMVEAPLPAYTFRVEGGEFVLEAVNAAARAQNPALSGLLGKPMARLYSDQPQVLEDARRCVAERTTVTRDTALRRYDRTEATQYLRLTWVFVPPERVVVFMQDLATPGVAETALRESEARYRSLVASLPDAVLLRAADGRVLACNDAMVRLWGAASQADLLGVREFLPPGYDVRNESGELVTDADLPSERVLRTGEAGPARVFAFSGHGVTRWLRVAAEPIHATSGAVSGSVTVYTDITERVAAQGELRESKARLDLALAAARMGVWEYEPAKDEGWWSSNLHDIFRFPESAVDFVSFLSRVHEADRAALAEALPRLLGSAEDASFERDFRIVGEDQVVRWARVRGSLSLDGGRTLLGGTIMDVTEPHRLEEELRRAHRLESLGRLAGGVAHDFNNLLAAMMGSLELVETQCPPSAREDLATIRHGAERARDLTRQLLAFARKQPVEWKTVDLSALVRTVERMLKRLVGPTIELVIQSEGPVSVRADPSQLEQVLVNLVVNAREAMPEGGRLEVRVSRRKNPESGLAGGGGLAVLEVSDSGVGMNEETQRRVFDPFFTTKEHGTGLGLASIYGIVQQHGGDIVVESAPGRGARFAVLLPCVEDAAEKAPSDVPASPPPSKGCVLVIDDEPLVRTTAARVLKSLGYDVLSADSAASGLERSAQHAGRIDILLCDVAMPGRDGPSVAAELRQKRPGLKIVFVSGYAETSGESLLPGSSFLQKPYTRAELLAKLEEA
jgi:PAS domain S-box-containing protein